MRVLRLHLFLSIVILLIFSIRSFVYAGNPTTPIRPDDNIQDPGALTTPWGGCGPTDSNCYVSFFGGPATFSTLNITAGPNTISGTTTFPLGSSAIFNGNTTFLNAPTISSFSSGSIIFSGVGGVLSQDATNFFWDNGSKFLGIGTNNPTQKLDIRGNLRLDGALMPNNSAGLSGDLLVSQGPGVAPVWQSFDGTYFKQNGNSFGGLATLGTNDLNGLVFETNNTERLRIDASGNIGIGDTTPAALFTVGNGDLFQVNSSGAITAATGITSSGTITFSGLGINSAVYTNGSSQLTTTAPTSGTLGYWARSGTQISPATITDEVNIGSTTDLGDYKLQVAGSLRVEGTSTNQVQFTGNNSFNPGFVFNGSNSETTIYRIISQNFSTNAGPRTDISGGYLQFGNNSFIRGFQQGIPIEINYPNVAAVGFSIDNTNESGLGSYKIASFKLTGTEKIYFGQTNSYFADEVWVGSTSDQGAYKLQVTGDVRIAGLNTGLNSYTLLPTTGTNSSKSAANNFLDIGGTTGTFTLDNSATTYSTLRANYATVLDNFPGLANVLADTQVLNGGSFDTVRGFYSFPQAHGSGSTITNYYGLYLRAPYTSSGGNITNMKSVYAEAGSGNAYFGDEVQIGSTTDFGQYQIQVTKATTSQTTEARVANFSNTGATFNTTAGALSSYGGYFSSTSTRSVGSNALTNIGLYSTASGGQNNYAAVFDQGFVGLGTTTPTKRLDVVSIDNTASTEIARFSSNNLSQYVAIKYDAIHHNSGSAFDIGLDNTSSTVRFQPGANRIDFITNSNYRVAVDGNGLVVGNGYANGGATAPTNGLAVQGETWLGSSADLGAYQLQVTGDTAFATSGTIKAAIASSNGLISAGPGGINIARNDQSTIGALDASIVFSSADIVMINKNLVTLGGVYGNNGYSISTNNLTIGLNTLSGIITGSSSGDAFKFDTSGAQTGGNLFNLKNNGTSKLVVDFNGNLGVGDTTPNSLFTVGNGDLFQVNSSGYVGIGVAPSSSIPLQITNTDNTNFNTYLNNTGGVGRVLRLNTGSFSSQPILSVEVTSSPVLTVNAGGSSGVLNVTTADNTNFAAIINNGPAGTGRVLKLTSGTVTANIPILQVDNNSGTVFGVYGDGNLGVGDTTPNSLFTVGNGDLFQVNSSGQIGSQQAPVSDYLFALAGTTGNDHSRIIDITQADNADESTSAITITGTPSPGTIAANRIIDGIANSLTPSLTANSKTATISGTKNTISLSSSVVIGSTASADAEVNTAGSRISITGSPDYLDPGGGSFQNLYAYGVNSSVSLSPTITAIVDARMHTYGGYFTNTSTSGGNSGLNSQSYGILATTSGNLTTTGTTSHYGGYFSAGGSADTNYGIYIDTISGGTNNYSLITSGTANAGIGDTTPDYLLDVENTGTDGNIFALKDSDGECLHNPEAGAETVTCSSDERLKQNIINAHSAIEYFRPFKIREYDVIASGDHMIGVIAQEVLQVDPTLVTTTTDGLYSVKLPNQWQVVKAIQELDVRISKIEDLTPDGPFFARLKNWLGDIANGLERLFAKEVRTEKLCITDQSSEVCVTKAELESLIQNRGQIISSPPVEPLPADPEPETIPPSSTGDQPQEQTPPDSGSSDAPPTEAPVAPEN